MRELAKLGFTQSYTYFTWKNSRHEMIEYFNELAWGEEKEYFRPNFFPVTPDILHAYLQHGGPPAFVTRLVLAATLSPSYGIYSGFENFENVPVREGSEEYLNSEKYEIRERDLDGPLLPMIRRLNEIRRENPALQHLSQRVLARGARTTRSSPTPSRSPATRSSSSPTSTRTTPRRACVTIPAQLGTAAGVRGRGPDDRRRTTTGGSAATTCALDPHGEQTHILKVL